MARRDPGEGSLHQRKDGRHAGSFWVKDHTGKRKRQYVYGRTRAEAREKLRLAKLEYEKKGLPTGEKQTLAGWLESWLTTGRITGTLKPGTCDTYGRAIARDIVPSLGHILLHDLNPEILQGWINELAERFAPRTVRRVYATLSSALQAALRMKKIPYDPCSGVVLPRLKKYQPTVLNAQQARALVEAAKKSPLKSMLVVALATGMRKGELRALRWKHVDLEKAQITVTSTLSYLPDQDGRYRYLEGDPKSETSVRRIALPLFAVETLRAQRTTQNALRLRAGDKWQVNDLVFSTKLGRYYAESVLQQQFKRLLEAAGLPEMRFHDLRHSAATILFAMKVNPKVVQRRLGHASVKMTLEIYGQATQEMEEAAMEDLDAAYRQLG